MRISTNIVVATPVMGGKPKIFSSLKSCCEELKLNYGTLTNFFAENGVKWNNGEWVVYKESVAKQAKRGKGVKENVVKKKDTAPKSEVSGYFDNDGNWVDL